MHRQSDPGIRAELLEWSEPLITDQINHFYFRYFTRDTRLARDLAFEHYRVWWHVLRDEIPDAVQARAQLETRALARGLSVKLLDELDRAVLDELMDVVLSRFRRTPFIARSYGMTLLDTATNLAQTRRAQIPA